MSRQSSLNLPLKLSLVPFCQGFPGSLRTDSMCLSLAHFSSARLKNSEPRVYSSRNLKQFAMAHRFLQCENLSEQPSGLDQESVHSIGLTHRRAVQTVRQIGLHQCAVAALAHPAQRYITKLSHVLQRGLPPRSPIHQHRPLAIHVSPRRQRSAKLQALTAIQIVAQRAL